MQSKAVLLILFSVTMVCGQECDIKAAQQCFQQHSPAMTESWPTNKEDLQKKCNDFTLLVDCVKRKLEKCNPIAKKAFDGVDNFKTKVCNENSSMAKGLVQHNECLRKFQPEMQQCLQSKASPGLNPCTVVHHIAECSDEFYGKQCGGDANQLAKQNYAVSFESVCPKEVKDHLSSGSSKKYSALLAFMPLVAMLLMRLWN